MRHQKYFLLLINMMLISGTFTSCISVHQLPSSNSTTVSSSAATDYSSEVERNKSSDIPSSDNDTPDNKNTPDIEKNEKYQIASNLYIAPVVSDKNLEQLNDQELTQIASSLFEQASLVWTYLLAGISEIETDSTQFIDHDGSVWYKVKYIHSFDDYQKIVDSIYEKSNYSELIYPAIQYCMIEKNESIYLCPERVGGFSGTPYIDLIDITKITTENNQIQVYAKIKNAIRIDAGEEYEWTDGILRYTILKQNGYWVLQSFYGEKL